MKIKLFSALVMIAVAISACGAPSGGDTLPYEAAPNGVQPTNTLYPTQVPYSTVCRLDKVSTINEQYSTAGEYLGPQRIEVAGHGVQHTDYYPIPGVKAISYIVGAILPPEVPYIWMGHGSIWEGNGPECQSFDWIADATFYAKARLDSGHSGLVVDMRDGTMKVVANVANMNQSDIDALLAVHQQGMQGKLSAALVSSAGGNTLCGNGVRADRTPVKGEPFKFNNSKCWVIVNVWSNETDPNYGDHKLLLAPDENPALLVGGAYWTFSSEATARGNYASNGLDPVTLTELQALGFVK